MIRLSWDNFKLLLEDSSVKYRVIEENNDYVFYAKDDWLEFICDSPISVEADDFIKSKKIKKIKAK